MARLDAQVVGDALALADGGDVSGGGRTVGGAADPPSRSADRRGGSVRQKPTTTREEEVVTEAVCTVGGCRARAHGRGLCRLHYDQERYLATTGRDPEAQERAGWEAGVEDDLRYGCVPTWRSPHGTGSMFATERERREAWEAHRDQLMTDYLEPPILPGRRPDAWWEFEAGRPRYLTKVDSYGDLGTTTRMNHEREVESLAWMARHGHLTGLELETLERRAAEARERIGTDREQKAALSPNFGGDKLRLAMWDAVSAALPPARETTCGWLGVS